MERAYINQPNSKSTGIDNIKAEFLSKGGYSVNVLVFIILKVILTNICVPACMQHSIISPLYKGKGKDKFDPNSYRLIALISRFYVTIEKLIMLLVSDDVYKHLDISQFGFTPGFSTDEPLFILKSIINLLAERRLKLQTNAKKLGVIL